jgi:hypothetical protein
MNLTTIFGSKRQTQLVEYLLDHPNRVFNQAGLSRFLFCSPSTISRVIEPLLEEDILVYEQISGQMKIIALNTESDKVIALMDFYQIIKQL